MQLLVMGAGGHAREVLDVLETLLGKPAAGVHTALFTEPGETSETAAELVRARGYDLTSVIPKTATQYLVAVGLPRVRRRFSGIAERHGLDPGSAVSPLSLLPSEVAGSPGLVCFAGTQVSTNVTFGKHCHLNQMCSVSHDVCMGDFVTLSPGVVLTGSVRVDDDVFVGAGAVVLPGVHIGRGAVIGAGAVVQKNVPPGATVVGNPARVIEAR
jgi:sugar O-acyltransferase (sialic acid O-acetyltransferase NeuD family)